VMLGFRCTVITVAYMSLYVPEFMCESIVLRVGCRRKTVHVRYIISWWASCRVSNKSVSKKERNAPKRAPKWTV